MLVVKSVTRFVFHSPATWKKQLLASKWALLSEIYYNGDLLLQWDESAFAVGAKPIYQCRVELKYRPLICTLHSAFLIQRLSSTSAVLWYSLNYGSTASSKSHFQTCEQSLGKSCRLWAWYFSTPLVGSLGVRFWLCIVSSFFLDMLFNGLSTGRFFRRILPSTRKDIPWHTHSLPILSTQHYRKPAVLRKVAPACQNKHAKSVAALPITIQITRQTLLKANFEHNVTVTISALRTYIVESRISDRIRQKSSAAYGAVDALPSQSLHIRLCNLPEKAIHQLQRMVEAYFTNLPKDVMIPSAFSHQRLPTKLSKKVDHFVCSEFISARSDIITVNGKKDGGTNDTDGDVHYIPSSSRES